MKAVTPIVVQAEAEDALPGLALFVHGMKNCVMAARKQNAIAHITKWNVARAIFEFSARADVQACVKAMNRQPDGKLKPGRPKTAHGIVMDTMAAKNLVTRRSIEKWVYDWYRPGHGDEAPSGISVLLKLKPGCAEKEFHQLTSQNPDPAFVEDTLEKLSEQRGGESDEPDNLPPAQWADKTLRPLMREFFDPHGNPRVLPKPKVKALAEKLAHVLEPFGWAIAPKAKH